MAGPNPVATRRICPEVIDEETGQTCGTVHMATACDTCPAHIRATADAFWATMGTTTPDTSPHVAASPPAPPKARKRPGKRQRRRT